MDFDAYARRLWTGRADAYERGFARLAVLPDLPLPDGEFDVVTGNFAIQATGDPAPDVPVAPFHRYSSPGAFAGLLAAAGFAEATAQLPNWEHRTDPGQWWDVYRSSVGSSGAVIARQDDATIERIKDEFDRLAARYAVGDGMIALPAIAVLASGTRP